MDEWCVNVAELRIEMRTAAAVSICIIRYVVEHWQKSIIGGRGERTPLVQLNNKITDRIQ
jgi:hypothetical protein